MPVASRLATPHHGPRRRSPVGLPPGACGPGGAGRRARGDGRVAAGPGGHDQQGRHIAGGDRQVIGSRGRVPQGAGDPAETGRRQPGRHPIPQRPGAEPQQPRQSCWRRRASRRRRRPSTARRWQSSRSWPTTTPPSPNSAATWQQATTTSASCCRIRASHRKRRLNIARRWRSSRSWRTTIPPSPTSAAAWRKATSTSAGCCIGTGKSSEAEARVPRGTGDPAEAGGRQSRRHCLSQPPREKLISISGWLLSNTGKDRRSGGRVQRGTCT